MSETAKLAALALVALAATVFLPARWWLERREAPPAMQQADILQEHLRRKPQDARGWVILARAHMAAERFTRAAEAYEKAIAASPKVERDAQVWCELADALGMAQGGTLAGKPRQAVQRALAAQADHPCALEMGGSAAYEAGEYRLALSYWEPLLAHLDPASVRHLELTTAIARTRSRSGS